MSHFALKRNLVTRKCWPGNRDYMVNFHPGMPGSQLAGLKFFHVIAKLIFSVFHRRAEIPGNRASPPHVIGPLKAQQTNAFFAAVNQVFGSSSQLPTTAERCLYHKTLTSIHSSASSRTDEVLARLEKKASEACVTAGSITFKHL